MNQDECREQLGRLMVEEEAALSELSALLDREHGFLTENDVVALEGVSQERQYCVARIFRVDEERRALCTQVGYPLDPKGLEQLLLWCDPKGTLAPTWAKCSATALRCRSLNDRNGVLVGARLKHVQERLGTLIAGRREPATYGPRGIYSQGTAGRVLATEA
ncbi:MAG TPA: flagellar protein FlgN [Acidobacteriaceae bacterium]|nr:flagellar protein FlgN [Acidobacteriaceae bacterium]